MVTNHLLIIESPVHEPIAQIGMFDGCPLTVGSEILKILIRDREQRILSQLHRCEILSERDYRNYVRNGRLDEDALDNAHPNFWWGDGAGLLRKLLEDDNVMKIHSEYEFVYQATKCEWVYVVDYNQDTFEIYAGFNRKQLGALERFFNDGFRQGRYYPPRMIRKYDLAALPAVREFKEYFA